MNPCVSAAATTRLRTASIAVLAALAALAAPASAQISIGIGLPHVGIDIGYNVQSYPNLRLVPGYPVYYVPGMDANYFYYDGMFWIFQGDYWYSSAWYNGPWQVVGPADVPDYVLRVPVGYYGRPPMFFGGWQRDAPPRWGEHWGAGWTQQRGDWDRWDHRSAPAAAPPPSYQQRFSGAHYPRPEQQGELRRQQDHYQPHDPVVRRVMDAQQQRGAERPSPPPAGAPAQRQRSPGNPGAQPRAATPEQSQQPVRGNPAGQPPVATPQQPQQQRVPGNSGVQPRAATPPPQPQQQRGPGNSGAQPRVATPQQSQQPGRGNSAGQPPAATPQQSQQQRTPGGSRPQPGAPQQQQRGEGGPRPPPNAPAPQQQRAQEGQRPQSNAGSPRQGREGEGRGEDRR